MMINAFHRLKPILSIFFLAVKCTYTVKLTDLKYTILSLGKVYTEVVVTLYTLDTGYIILLFH